MGELVAGVEKQRIFGVSRKITQPAPSGFELLSELGTGCEEGFGRLGGDAGSWWTTCAK